ncbi:MAG: hypothetical protein ACI9PD_001765, partial [Psychrobacter glaciei]
GVAILAGIQLAIATNKTVFSMVFFIIIKL